MKLTVPILFILFLLLLATTGEGIRLSRQSFANLQKHFQQKENSFIERDGTDILCENRMCADTKGSLTNTTMSTSNIEAGEKKESTKTTQENKLKEDRARKNLKNSSSNTEKPAMEQKNLKTETYPDLVDIAGMDYSPTKRKPPIHN